MHRLIGISRVRHDIADDTDGAIAKRRCSYNIANSNRHAARDIGSRISSSLSRDDGRGAADQRICLGVGRKNRAHECRVSINVNDSTDDESSFGQNQ